MKPSKVNILGKPYQIIYVDNPSDVDIHKRESYWGQIDLWTSTIRIYDNETSAESLLHTLIHEILHGISVELKLGMEDNDESHDKLDLLALGISDFLVRNGWLKDD